MKKTELLIELISSKNKFQRKYLANWKSELNNYEKEKLDNLIGFYIEKGNTILDLANSYLYMCDMYTNDYKYFLEYNKYRYETLKEASMYIYNDVEIMKNYMLGLAISTYLWTQHREIMRFFIEQTKLISRKKGKYLEIGSGHGEYFVAAMENTDFDTYLAVDISETSVNITRAFCEYSLKGSTREYEVLLKDFFDFRSDDKFDAIIMGEVLEHVENPMMFLKKYTI